MHLGQPDGEREAGAKHRVRKAIGRHVGRGTARHAIGVQHGALGDHLNLLLQFTTARRAVDPPSASQYGVTAAPPIHRIGRLPA